MPDITCDILRVSFLVGAALLAPIAPVRAESAADTGRDVYAEHCAQCHGERLMATGAAPDLKLLRADQRARFDQMVRDGKGQMPAWAGMITDEEIDQVWAYIRSRAEN
jgi:mono/diheme cytochrome c family protein